METFHKNIELVNPKENMEKYFVNNTDDVLSGAFTKKTAVHAGLMDRFVEADKTQSVLSDVLNQKIKNKTAAYIHVPFCETYCLYCGFYNQPYKKESSKLYTDAVIKEIMLWEKSKAVKEGVINTLYFGGGTPTALEADDMKRLLSYIKQALPLANDCEITIEGRISNFTDEKIEAYLFSGVNRFSLGVQSFNTDIRRAMGRRSNRDTIIERIKKLKSYNQSAIVLDLIYGFPNQTMDIWVDDIKTAQSLKIDGFDCYQLNVFPFTPLGKLTASGKISPAGDVKMKSEMFKKSVELMEQALYTRLSVNHWQRTTRERNLYNRFARGYASCLAFGPGAGGNINGHSYMVNRDYNMWLESVNSGIKPLMGISIPDKNYGMYKEISEEFETGRIDMGAIQEEYGVPIMDICRPVLNQWEESGVIKVYDDKIVLTLAGQFWFVNLSQLLQEYLKLTLMFESKKNNMDFVVR